jgi:hypothetical protein
MMAGVVALGAFTVSGIVAAQKHHRPAGPDAFLDYQVDSTSELVAALQSNPALRRRYARHFGVSEARVIEFVKNALVPYRLPAARSVTTYGVTKSGTIYAVRTRLPKGTRVWATRSGEPVLKWLCANPLTKTLPGTRLVGKPRTARMRPARRGLAAPAPPADAGEILVLEEASPVPAAPPVPVVTVTSSAAPGVPGVSGATVFTSAASPAAGGRPGGAYWVPLGLAAGFIVPHGVASSGLIGGTEFPPAVPSLLIPPPFPPGGPISGGPISGGPISGGPETPPVPEPSAMVTMGAFLAAAGLGVLRNRRRRGRAGKVIAGNDPV